ncbi:tRNA preQ1(34) S-adenosylmethionine ribosyltransferase-isomerase QueA [Methylobacterium mesophilicum]|uniref:tRNA preQ1(34) S-adenosylmethionine ribosyltransferase-isomerase QueA n=1 Tax=Methylobacterium TaxID=407 RepID=UPI0011CA8C8E|nr:MULTISPECIES: tRNA preQ1(34) S-adenosylmethionine ribosyltransferase-isomerase QueA [Methylobacterium]TXN48409.1 tRNA preQ1(34) S-adenosylmethionine ribosyltransferase-isomerase QueA [Methylobacterium sp. WL7]TXN74544.1 tRNA preQ1(34) S-adenosylmethionine ribosyltransferase-isomerase QueA [Methylobacterium sp. WL18]GJE19858.1 S-adenosylmethionine:tRNA ribosyltransferase-isomerase [Methylobacterium mesophilicum]
MRVDLFDFDLPESSIALRPAEPRDGGRLLVVHPGEDLADRTVRDLPAALRSGDALVFNDTRVIPARLNGVRTRPGAPGQRTEVMLHLREAPARWRAFARPAKRLTPGDAIQFGALQAIVAGKAEGGEIVLDFDRGGAELDAAIAQEGALPLPPYIAGKRPTDARDATDYQTVYARHPGAVAAPTAGLHFSDALLADLDAAGLRRHHVTLHVGAGTFLPVKADDTDGHRMHAEIGILDADTAGALNAVRAAGCRIVAVGTTALRLLESAASPDGTLSAFSGPTDIFITPGYRFRAVDALVTNFHLPRSTLFMLVSAFSGLDTMRAAYAHAIRSGYRFYSYGDASLLFPGPRADIS